MKIKGIPVGTTMPRSNLEQTDPKKADYVRGRDAFIEALEEFYTPVNRFNSAVKELEESISNVASIQITTWEDGD